MTYLWNTNETSVGINIPSTGLYYLSITDTNFCMATDSISITFLNCLSIDEFSEKPPIYFYENTLKISPSESERNTIRIYNTLGQIIQVNENEESVDLNWLTAGIYIAVIDYSVNKNYALKIQVK